MHKCISLDMCVYMGMLVSDCIECMCVHAYVQSDLFTYDNNNNTNNNYNNCDTEHMAVKGITYTGGLYCKCVCMCSLQILLFFQAIRSLIY